MRATPAVISVLLATASAAAFPRPVLSQDWAGRFGTQLRGFLQSAAPPSRSQAVASVSLEPEYQRSWGANTVRVAPFLRIDSSDRERTHADVRELIWRSAHDGWDARVGIGRVFWGAVESVHLVDVINQTDLVENIDGEDKLGQPMTGLTLVRGPASLELYALFGFRPRTFPGEDGRPRLALPVATGMREFESGGTGRVDGAVRGLVSVRGWDVAVSHFHGMGREPRFVPGADDRDQAVLIPIYGVVDQTGIEVQGVTGGWLWKAEAISRGQSDDRFEAFAAGFEYTFAAVGGCGFDLGVLAEYLYDGRGDAAPTPFSDDLFAGLRIEANDAQSTRVLAGAIVDRAGGGTLASIEGSRRLGTRWTLEVEGRFFMDVPAGDYLYGLRRDDYLQLDMSWYL